MKKIINAVVLFIFIINMTGCATILKPKDTQIKVDSEPQGAEVYITKQRMFGRRDVAEHFFKRGPRFPAVHAPAPEFHRVGGHKRGRVRVLRHGGDHF